jgi:hypothetical protein
VPGTEIESDVLRQRVPLCKACNVQAKKPPGKKGKRKKVNRGGWESDEYDDPVGALKYPPGIMKVPSGFPQVSSFQLTHPMWIHSPTSHFSVKS